MYRKISTIILLLAAVLLTVASDLSVSAQDKATRWVESIKVLSPAPCSDVGGRVKMGLQAKGMKQLKAQCYVADEGIPRKLVLTPAIKLNEDGAGSFWLNAKKLPHGPLTVQITGNNEAGECDLYELQLYNTAGKRASAGIPDTIPSAARGMRQVFSDDFDGPLSISRDGRGTRYNAHKPTFGDFSG